MQKDTMITVIAFMISGVWAIAALGSLLTQEYTPLSIITPVMLIVAGFLFGRRAFKNGNGEDK